MKLLLFDIDGTILKSRGLGRRCVEQALSAAFGRSITTRDIVFSGKTDPQIIREVLLSSGLEGTAEQMREALDAYATCLEATLQPEHVTPLPGVQALVEHLATDASVQLALLTGNLEPLAYLKLRAVGLADFFPFGAFGSDAEVRSLLPAVAVRRARAHTGRDFGGKDVVIIGDTEHDICCGRGIGAFAVGVCTGNYSRDDLAPHGPDVLLDSLDDPGGFVRSVVRRAA